ncbi:hypothetical protein H4R35_005067 [Dimargaris xerosporica]|nr:hypothetical protein H4R35_005067 [Dimargaris xerosporica]
MAPIHSLGVLALALVSMTQSAWAAPRLVRRANNGKDGSVQSLYSHVYGQSWQNRLQYPPEGSGSSSSQGNGMRTTSEPNGHGAYGQSYDEFSQNYYPPSYLPVDEFTKGKQSVNSPLTSALTAQKLQGDPNNYFGRVDDFGWGQAFDEIEQLSHSEAQAQASELYPPVQRHTDRPWRPFDDMSLTPVKKQPLPAAKTPDQFVQNYLQGLGRYERQLAENVPAVTTINTGSSSTTKSPKAQKAALVSQRVALLGQLAAQLCVAPNLSKEEKVTAMIIFINGYLLKGEYRANGNILLPLNAIFTTTGKTQQRIEQLKVIDPTAAKYLNDFPSDDLFENRMAKYIYHVLSSEPIRAKL